MGGHSDVTFEYNLTMCSPFVTLVLLLQNNVSLKIQWLRDSAFFRAPFTISAGCRLILSIREASSNYLSSNPVAMSTIIYQDGSGEDIYIA